MRLLALAVVLVAVLAAAPAKGQTAFNVDEICPVAWDDTIRRATALFMPTPLKDDWLRVKSQILQESSCRPDVCSHAGACGLMQLLRTTFEETARAFEEHGSIFDAKYNILVGTRYMGWLCKQWSRRGRTGPQVHQLCAASYISGLLHILKSQAVCMDARLWPDIQRCLERVITPENAEEVRYYVFRLCEWHARLTGGSSDVCRDHGDRGRAGAGGRAGDVRPAEDRGGRCHEATARYAFCSPQ